MAGKEIAFLTHSDDTELYHHGVKGMKWGQRKKRGNVGRRSVMAARNSLESDRVTSNNAVSTMNTIARANSGKTMGEADRREFDRARQMAERSQDHAKNSRDAIVAKRITVGEGVALSIITGPIGATVWGVNHVMNNKALDKYDAEHKK